MSNLRVQLEGITLADYDRRRFLLLNATYPRVARTNEMVVIPAHYPFIALREDQHVVRQKLEGFTVRRVSDVETAPRAYRIYRLQGHRISFPTAAPAPFIKDRFTLPAGTQFGPSNKLALHWAAQMGRLIPGKEMTADAQKLTPSEVAVAHVEIPTALVQTSSVNPNLRYRFLHTNPRIDDVPVSDRLSATMAVVSGARHVVRVDSYNPGLPNNSFELELKPSNVDWQIIVGNVLLEELVNERGRPNDDFGNPMYHFEIHYDAFRMGQRDKLPLPVVITDDAPQGGRGGGGCCGPPGG